MDDLDNEVAGFDEFLELERGSVERVGELADRAAQALVPSVDVAEQIPPRRDDPRIRRVEPASLSGEKWDQASRRRRTSTKFPKGIDFTLPRARLRMS